MAASSSSVVSWSVRRLDHRARCAGLYWSRRGSRPVTFDPGPGSDGGRRWNHDRKCLEQRSRERRRAVCGAVLVDHRDPQGVVMFMGDRAYKWKRPVVFPFLDQRSVEARRQACEDEVRLNRRLAPDVYLGVGELVGPGDEGREPVIVMRRLPTARRLSRMIMAGAAVEGHIRNIAHQVAALHASASTTALAAEAAGLDAVTGRWVANAAEIDAMASVSDMAEDSRAVLAARGATSMDAAACSRARIDRGWARDGHGDLLADDIFCCDDGPRILDCLEFDERLRVGDVLADAASWRWTWNVSVGRSSAGRSCNSMPSSSVIAGRPRWRTITSRTAPRFGPRWRWHVPARGCAAGMTRRRWPLGIAGRHLRAGRARLVLVGGSPGTGSRPSRSVSASSTRRSWSGSDELRKEVAGLPADARVPSPPHMGITASA